MFYREECQRSFSKEIPLMLRAEGEMCMARKMADAQALRWEKHQQFKEQRADWHGGNTEREGESEK